MTRKFLIIACFLNGCVSQQVANETATQTPPKLNNKVAASAPNTPIDTVDTSPSKKLSTVSPPSHADATKVTQWHLSGALAARNAQKAWSASIQWAQQGASNYQMRLMGPIGGGTVLIERHGGNVTFKDGKKVVQSHNADSLLAEQTGIRLPVNNLYYWVRGMPAPGNVQAEHRDNQHRLQTLQQAGYKITYVDYMNKDAKSLPRKIQLAGNGVTLKLVIQHW